MTHKDAPRDDYRREQKAPLFSAEEKRQLIMTAALSAAATVGTIAVCWAFNKIVK